MHITADLLRDYNACKEGISFIEQNYPKGADMIDIIQDKNVAREFLHWGRKYLTHSEEELEAYCQACEIVNSTNYWNSSNISNSDIVIGSQNIKNSCRIFDSLDVFSSNDIVESIDIKNSKQIFVSQFIESSQRILNCKNISNSTNIYNSQIVHDSQNIYESIDIWFSSEIIKSEQITNCHFCVECQNISNCMFCYGLKDAEYYLFNKPVDKFKYELFKKQYLSLFQGELCFVEDWPTSLLKNIVPFTLKRFDKWYRFVPDKFWNWCKTLPNYDDMIMYQMTMLSKFLLGDRF